MQVICLEEKAFYALIEEVVDRLKDKFSQKQDKWVSGEEAMAILRIKSKTTLQKLRDEGSIRFSQPEKKIILYDVDSINDYISQHAKDTF
jgi:Helix-turn-helix domain